MEKYGVHQNDPFEKEANNMVKTGFAKNIDSARKKISPNDKEKIKESK